MKITWFSGTTLRIQIGGRILVVDPVPIDGVAADELVSGADVVFHLDDAGEAIDPALWQPRRVASMLDATDLPEVVVHGVAGGALIAAMGEAPLLLLRAPMSAGGRWTREAIVVVLGEDVPAVATAVLERMAPRIIAIGAGEQMADEVFVALASKLDGTGLVALEPGLAVEV